MLYANGITTLSGLDNAAGNVQGDFEKYLFDFSQESPDKWKTTQNQFDCCGVDFEAGLDVDPGVLGNLENGDKCTDAAVNITRLQELRAEAEADPLFDPEEDEFQPAAEDPTFGDGTDFFCKDVLAAFLTDNTVFIGLILGAVLVAQLASIVSASRMYWVSINDEGWFYELEGKYHIFFCFVEILRTLPIANQAQNLQMITVVVLKEKPRQR